MKGLDQWLLPYILSQVVSLLLLWLCIKSNRWGRIALSLLFLYAGVYNMYIGLSRPDEYLNFADFAIPLYKRIIRGWFSLHNGTIIPLIAIGQFLSGTSLLLGGIWPRLGIVGVIAFLIAIAPLMTGSAFPFSVTVSIAAMILWRKKQFLPIWREFLKSRPSS
jgi:uncharacterized membrane protein YphA (DoxX/SURF4 family)